MLEVPKSSGKAKANLSSSVLCPNSHDAIDESYTGIKLATASRSFPIELEKLTTLNGDHDSVVLNSGNWRTTSDHRQSIQFQHLNEEKQNIQVEVVRGGKRCGASIFDLVVGHVVPLNIADQERCDCSKMMVAFHQKAGAGKLTGVRWRDETSTII